MSRLVALTGATGFIGTALLQQLTAEGWHVRALTRSARHSQNDLVEWIQGDLNNKEILRKLVANCFAVIHCAGTVRGKNAIEFEKTNFHGTATLADTCSSINPATRFLLMSSLAARYPQYSWYANSKHLAEQILAPYIEDNTRPWTIFRPTAVYGPGDKEIKPLLNAMRHGILPTPGGGNPRISLLHVDDLIRAILLWLSSSPAITGTFELDDGFRGGYTWEKLIGIGETVWDRRIYRVTIPMAMLNMAAGLNLLLSRLLPYAPMLTPGKVREITHPDWTCDNSILTKMIGWQPEIKLQNAMQEAA